MPDHRIVNLVSGSHPDCHRPHESEIFRMRRDRDLNYIFNVSSPPLEFYDCEIVCFFGTFRKIINVVNHPIEEIFLLSV